MPLFQGSIVGQIEEPCKTGAITPVPASTTSVLLLEENLNRKGATVTNASTAKLYLSVVETSAVEAYSVPLEPGDYWETPFNYKGVLSGVWESANGSAMITEFI